MRNRHRGHEDDRAAVRDALRRAPGAEEPDTTRLIAAVPALMMEARRRRSELARPSAAPTLAERARLAVPRLAIATVVLVILASTSVLLDAETSSAASAGALESVILVGTEKPGGDTSDILLEAVMKEDQGHV